MFLLSLISRLLFAEEKGVKRNTKCLVTRYCMNFTRISITSCERWQLLKKNYFNAFKKRKWNKMNGNTKKYRIEWNRKHVNVPDHTNVSHVAGRDPFKDLLRVYCEHFSHKQRKKNNNNNTPPTKKNPPGQLRLYYITRDDRKVLL